MATTNYYNSFIQVAEDCPVLMAEVPVPKNGKPTVASMQYEMIAAHPYQYTSDDVIFAIHAARNNIEKTAEQQEAFFAKGQPCLRSSPLTKRYGWGVHSNSDGKIAIYPLGSDDYKRLSKESKLKQIKGMRSSRA